MADWGSGLDRYYRGPVRVCRFRAAPAEALEEAVLKIVARGALPADLVASARAELRRRLQTPDVADIGRQRARLTTRLEKLKQQHAWGDISDESYQAQRDEVRAALAGLPENDDRVAHFDSYRARLLALPEAIAVASPARREELCQIVLERVTVRDRQAQSIDWSPAARPFFKRQGVPPKGLGDPPAVK